MHYTDKKGYAGIIHPGIPGPYIMKPSPPEWSAPPAIYFTDALPHPGPSGPYDRHMISANVGIPYPKTEFYILIDSDSECFRDSIWIWRIMAVRVEWLYITSVPVDVTEAVTDHGPVSRLNH